MRNADFDHALGLRKHGAEVLPQYAVLAQRIEFHDIEVVRRRPHQVGREGLHALTRTGAGRHEQLGVQPEQTVHGTPGVQPPGPRPPPSLEQQRHHAAQQLALPGQQEVRAVVRTDEQ